MKFNEFNKLSVEQKVKKATETFRKGLVSVGRRIIDFADIDEIAYARKHSIEANLQIAANWFTEHWRGGQLIDATDQGHNLFTTEGMNFILDEVFNAGAACTGDQYVGLFDQNVTPAAGDTASAKLGAGGTYGELQATTEMDEAARQAYTVAAAASANVTNTASKATFTIAATRTIYGGFVVTDSDPTSTAGTLICAKKFTSSRSVVDDDVLNILISLTMTSS